MKASRTAWLSLRGVRHRPWLSASIFVLSQLVAAACWFLLPHHYRAEAVVLIDPVAAPTRLAAHDARANLFMAKVGLLTSSLVADEVIASTGLGRSQVMREAWASNAPDGVTFEEWLQLVVMGGVLPDGSAGSMVLKVAYVTSSPEFAKGMANAYAEALIRVSEALNRGTETFADRAFATAQERTKAELQAAQKALREGAGSNVLDDSLHDPALRAHLNSTRQTTALVNAHLESRARQQVVAQGGDAGSLLDDAFLNTQRQRLATLRGQQAEALTRLGEGHPVVRTLNASVRSVEGAIEQHEKKRKVASALGVQVRADAASVTVSQDAQQQAALLEREQRRLGSMASQAVVDSAAERYESALESAEMAALNRSAPAADVRLLSAAGLPAESWFPSLSYYLPVSLALGLLMAALGAGTMERLDRRVRSLDDVVEVVGSGWTGRLS